MKHAQRVPPLLVAKNPQVFKSIEKDWNSICKMTVSLSEGIKYSCMIAICLG